MITSTQSEFADLLGKDKSYVTRLKQCGRLVMTADGKVDVEASQKRILDTSGGRDDVAARHEAERARSVPEIVPEASKSSETRVDAQTRKEMAQADMAEMERDKILGQLIDRAEVEMALADLVAFARQGVENLPHRVAADLVNKSFEQIIATLKQEIIAMMGDMHKEAGKRLAELTRVIS